MAQTRAGIQYIIILAVLAGLPAGGRAQVSPGSVAINFDDTTVTGSFSSSRPLRGEYEDRGVTFAGPTANNGGAIIDYSGNFNVTGFSTPNFFAFNTGASFSIGGVPAGPETLSFSPPVRAIRMMAGAVNAGTITLQALNVNGSFLAGDTVTGQSALQLLEVYGNMSGEAIICRAVIAFTGTVLVIDDLSFDRPVSTELHLPDAGGARLAVSPNPFASSATVSYRVAGGTESVPVRCSIYNAAGVRVADLVNGRQPAGNYSSFWNAGGMPNGIYLIRLRVGTQTFTRQLALMR
jgi:hypothetical protein